MAAPKCRDCGCLVFDAEGRCAECRTFPTLGFDVDQWIYENCVIPDRDVAGLPFRLTDEQAEVFLNHYRINPHAKFTPVSQRFPFGLWRGAWVYERGTQVTKPQKWGKAPISSAWVCVEAAPDGPVVFDGWDADGQPVGRPWPQPHMQVTACSEDQTDNVWRALLPMIQLGPLANVFTDSGLTRINTPTGGLIEPVTAAAISRLGQRIQGALQDQTESWLSSNGGIKLADNQRRGLAGTGGRFFETPNAWDPVDGSVAQRTFESEPGVFKTYEHPPEGSVRDWRERDKVLRVVYGDSTIERGGWIDIDRIHSEIEALLEHDAAQAERWFMNRILASEGAAFDFEKWLEKARKRKAPPKGARIVIGVDGALNDDALAIVACEVKTGFVWPLHIWERPADAGPDYEHPKHEVDGVVTEAFDFYSVWRLYADDQWIENLIERWQNRYGEKRVLVWRTNRWRQIAWAVRNFEQAVHGKSDLTHSGDDVLTRHIQNSRKRKLNVDDDRQMQMHTLAKPAQHSPLKVDGAMAAVLAWECRGDAIAHGVISTVEHKPLADPARPRQWMPDTALPAAALAVPGESGPFGSLS